jgi:hypothetical protein
LSQKQFEPGAEQLSSSPAQQELGVRSAQLLLAKQLLALAVVLV